MVNFLRSIENKLIIYENYYPLRKRTLLSGEQVKYVQDIIVSGYIAKFWVVRKEVIQVI